MRYLVLITSLLFFSTCHNRPQWQTGDLIFQDLDCPLCDAIENATRGFQNKPVSHVGIIVIQDEKIFVIEAYDKVQIVPLDTFLKRSPKILVGRLKPPYRKYIPKAVQKAYRKIGLPYDEVFQLNNEKYYCSELIYDIFTDENDRHLFDVYPMNFKNLRTGRFDSIWIAYFDKLNRPIPQGRLGCNPAEYSRNPKIEIIYTTY